jgi:hypothetical protein
MERSKKEVLWARRIAAWERSGLFSGDRLFGPRPTQNVVVWLTSGQARKCFNELREQDRHAPSLAVFLEVSEKFDKLSWLDSYKRAALVLAPRGMDHVERCLAQAAA